MSNLYRVFLLWGVAVFFNVGHSFAPCDGTNLKPCIVQDSPHKHSHLKKFRAAPLIKVLYTGNVVGVERLRVSGSEQPSEQGWMDLVGFVNELQKTNNITKVIVVDLRQESHGYLNGKAFTLVGENNWLNVGKSDEENDWAQVSWLDALSSQKSVEGVLTPDQFAAKQFSAGKTLVLHSVHDEAWYANQYGYEYKRFFVTDHHAPSDADIDGFIKMMEQDVSGTTWFHVHCRGGKGRTTTFFAMMDIWYNASELSLDEIILRQGSIPPYYYLDDVFRTHPEFNPHYLARLKFLKSFHAFVKARAKGYKGAWLQWQQDQLL